MVCLITCTYYVQLSATLSFWFRYTYHEFVLAKWHVMLQPLLQIAMPLVLLQAYCPLQQIV